VTELPLFRALQEYRKSVSLPMHMPGHKGRTVAAGGMTTDLNMFSLDVTEVDGVDSLFHPTGALAEAERLAADLFGARETHFLVNGASIGLMAAVMTVTGPGDEIVVQRNAHRAIMSGIRLSGAVPVYVWPEIGKDTGIALGLPSEELEETLLSHPNAKAVVVSNPNFYGFCSDLREIALIARKYGKALIVDEACGSHFHLHRGLPTSGVDVAADIVVHGTHKSLPAMTQAAMLHVGSGGVDTDRLRENLMLLTSSSPSYVLLASLDLARGFAEEQAARRLDILQQALAGAKKSMCAMHGIRLLGDSFDGSFSVRSHDFTKLVVNCAGTGLSGIEAAAKLRAGYGMQCELADSRNILLTFTMLDGREEVAQAAEAIMWTLTEGQGEPLPPALPDVVWPSVEVFVTPREAAGLAIEEVPLANAQGRIAGETIAPFPPGVAIVRPGERINAGTVAALEKFRISRPIKVLK
jgi:lysine decarboxylase